MQTFTRLESIIKKELTRVYKEAHGKGPEETAIKIWGNILIAKLTGTLTPIELSLLHSEGGEALVHKIRDLLLLNQKEYFTALFENLLGCKVEDYNHILGIENNTLYIFLVFKENIMGDEMIPNERKEFQPMEERI